MKKLIPVIAALAIAAAGCTAATTAQPEASQPAVAVSPSPPPATQPAQPVVLAVPPSGWARPPSPVTPGAAAHSLAAICPAVSAALSAARPTAAVRDQVYARYGIGPGARHRFRIDHLVPLELDGSNSLRNLWPQPVRAAHAKDRLEATLHSLVCAGQITLATAQHAIRANWVRAYHRYQAPPAAPVSTPAPAAQPPPPPASPAPATSCHPLTNGGNCYEPGEFCRNSDHGVTGVAGDGEAIVCQDNNGWRWEPA
jgi:hypothetical protein